MTPWWVTAIIAILPTLLGIYSIWIQYKSQKEKNIAEINSPKTKADAAGTLVDKAVGLSETMQRRIIVLETKVSELEAKLELKDAHIDELEKELHNREREIDLLNKEILSLRQRIEDIEKHEQTRDSKSSEEGVGQ